MANPEHVKVVKQGAEAIAQWRRDHPRQRLDLSGANLRRANLFGADLAEVNLTVASLILADLILADLSGANLFGADLAEANLTGANLTGANLSAANLSGANLSGANLTGADLTGASLHLVKLSGAHLTGAHLGVTAVSATGLGQCAGLGAVIHEAPSPIGVNTLVDAFRGAGNRLTAELENFFLGAGVPKELLAALSQILAEVKYCTCFVCYGQPDLGFAERLVKDLKARGVPCWLYALDATPGERLWSEIGRRRREAEKMIVLCSAMSLVRDGVLKEIEEQIDEAPDKMVPVSLDNQWNQSSFRAMRTEKFVKIVLYLLDRNYADFSNEATYEASLEKLLKGLKRQA